MIEGSWYIIELAQTLIIKEQISSKRLSREGHTSTGRSRLSTAEMFWSRSHAAVIQPGTSHNTLNVYVVPWQEAALTLLRWGHPLPGRACMGVIIYAHLSPNASACNSPLAAFIGIANQCPGLLYLNSLWSCSSIQTTISLFFSFSLIPLSHHAYPTSPLSASSRYWAVCLRTGLRSRAALVPRHGAKASLSGMGKMDGEEGRKGNAKGATTPMKVFELFCNR